MHINGMAVAAVAGDYEPYIPLLLDADPSRALVESYLSRGTLWACADGRGPVCVALMMPTQPGVIELMNLATREDMRRRGIASGMIAAMKRHYAAEYDHMHVGTADGFPETQRFYERSGFVRTGTDYGFFVRNYPEPVMDGGRQCIDMARYSMALK